jgi:hypothetical protein
MKRHLICFNEKIRDKINKLVLFVNRTKPVIRQKLLTLLSCLESLLYADYDKIMAIYNFQSNVETLKILHFQTKHLLSQEVNKDIDDCIEYFEAVSVALELSKGGK